MQQKNVYPIGLEELKKVRSTNRKLLWIVGLFSVFINILVLTGPLYMLQVYDRVLSSRSVETLTALTVLVFVLFTFLGILDWARGRVLARIGAKLYSGLDERVFMSVLKLANHPHFQRQSINGLSQLHKIQTLYSSSALYAVFDSPWVPIFIGIIFIFHPMLGFLALGGGCLLVLVSYASAVASRSSGRKSREMRSGSDSFAQQIMDDNETVLGLGMHRDLLRNWKVKSDSALSSDILSNDLVGSFASVSKAFRMFIQAAILGLGAWLVLKGELSPGAMIAGSILLGRALAPLDMLIANWATIQAAREANYKLSELLQADQKPEQKVDLPVPVASLRAQNLVVFPPGSKEACLRNVEFAVQSGEALGVIGQSASGKSSLARAITGVWPVAGGEIRLGGATLDQYDPETLGRYIGYLPQNVALFDGSIAANIARMASNPDMKMVVKAAKNAGAHDLILEQEDGYNTNIARNSGILSGGQRQRIGLARALFGDPLLLVLDEPNSALDAKGGQALNAAIQKMKSEGKAAIIMSHRPSGIEMCETLLILQNGTVRAFGPRDEVMKKHVQNTSAIKDSFNKQNDAQ